MEEWDLHEAVTGKSGFRYPQTPEQAQEVADLRDKTAMERMEWQGFPSGFGGDGITQRYLEGYDFKYPENEAGDVASQSNINNNIQQAAEAGRNFTPGLSKTATGYSETSDATDTQAQLTRDQWEYYKQAGVPLEDTMYQSYRNEGIWDDAVQGATDVTNRQYDAARGTLQREQSRYGGGLNPRQQQASQRSMGLSQAAANVANRNNTRKMMQETDNAVMTGGSTQSVTLQSLMGN